MEVHSSTMELASEQSLNFFEIVTTPTQPQLNSKVGCDTKMTLQTTPPTTQTQCPPYLRCSGPDFNQTLRIGLWDQQQQ